MIQQEVVTSSGRSALLTLATMGMAAYGVYSVGTGLTDLFSAGRLEWWANLWTIGAGATLTLAAAFVRVSMPGGLALAVGGLLALQSIGLHNTGHLYGRDGYMLEAIRAAFALTLVGLAYVGWGSEDEPP